MDDILEKIIAYRAAQDCIKRTRFIVDMIEPGDTESVADIQLKHEQLVEFCEKYKPMMQAIEIAAKPYIDLIEMRAGNYSS